VLLVIDHHNGVPVYRQIVEQIRLQVASGVLNADDELPSTRALSAELALNPMTISKAYSLLEHDGVLERRRGQTLVVRARHADDVETNKLAELRRSLAAPAAVARQLGISPAQATRIFREVLDQVSERLPA
jgi:GntR family transcriptional regulator